MNATAPTNAADPARSPGYLSHLRRRLGTMDAATRATCEAHIAECEADLAKRWYGYEAIPALPGVFKCRGFQDDREAWFTAAMVKAYPEVQVFLGYRGDRIMVDAAGITEEVTQSDAERMHMQQVKASVMGDTLVTVWPTCPCCAGRGYTKSFGSYGQPEREECENCNGKGQVKPGTLGFLF